MAVKNYIFVTFFMLVSLVQSQTTYNITDPSQIETIENLSAGDTVILKNGTYSSDERIHFSGTGTIDAPITFTSETPGGVQFTGGLQMDISGSYLIVDGFYWNGGYGASNFIQFRNGSNYATNCTIQNCAINGLTAESADAAAAAAAGAIIKHRWIVLYGNHNSVLNCTFMNKNTAGALVLAEYEYNASPDEGAANTRCEEVGHIISNNYFYNYEKMNASLSNSGDAETIRIGTSEYQNVNSAAIISGNYFVQADGENEIITNKSSNNSYYNNTFRRCRGSLVMRHGANATVDGNYFLGENIEGTGGIRIADSKHTITNNYIQDCKAITQFSAWNNGLTFVGGNTSSVQDCNATSVSNDYQDVKDITFSNNTFVNTDSPIYFNGSRDGAKNVFGTVSKNIIYFESGHENITNVISGDYSDIGTGLTFVDNIYDGASGLGETVLGFNTETISVTSNGEIYTHNKLGYGASLSNAPITDDKVGNGVGACFLDFEANYISGSSCDNVIIIEPIDKLTVSSISALTYEMQSVTTTVNSNIDWSVSSDNNWINLATTSGSGNATLTISVTENTDTTSRSGLLTFTQQNGDLVSVLNIIQAPPEITDRYSLINMGATNDNTRVFQYSKEEVNDVNKFNYATNTLDKDPSTVWAADDLEGDGEFIIYDLGSIHHLDLIRFSTTNKSDSFVFQVFVSQEGTSDTDFEKVLPVSSSDYIFTETGTTNFNEYLLSTDARYIKVVGFGRTSNSGVSFSSVWSAIGEIEFYGELVNITDGQEENETTTEETMTESESESESEEETTTETTEETMTESESESESEEETTTETTEETMTESETESESEIFNEENIDDVEIPTSQEGLLVYPNPITENITISNDSVIYETASFYSISGLIVKQVNITSNNQIIDLLDLSNGIYFLELSNDSIVEVQKILIAK